MARRRARRGAGRRRGVGQPLPSTAALHRLDGCALAVVADYCALPDICALRHRISKRTSQQLASVDDSEVFARARVLQRVAEWWHVTLLPSEQDEDNILGSETRRKNKNYIWHQLRVLLRARHVRTLRLGGLQAFYEYSVQVIRIWHGNDIVRHLVEFPVRPGDLISLGSLEVMRKEVLRRLKEVSTGFPVYYRAYFSSQRFSEFLALDKALRRGTQRPRGCLVGPWRFCEQSLSLDYCPCCKRWRDQCRPEFHFRTTRRGGDPCPSCDLIPWVGALKRYRLTREQLPSSVTWNRKMYRTLAPNDSFFCVSMVLRSRAEEVARQVWGSDWNGRAARAKTRAHKKRRRRQRDAAAKRKSYNKAKLNIIKAALDAAEAAADAAADRRPVAARTRGKQEGDSDDDRTFAPPLSSPGDRYSTAFQEEMRSQGFSDFQFFTGTGTSRVMRAFRARPCSNRWIPG